MTKLTQGAKESTVRQRYTAFRNERGQIVKAGDTVQLTRRAFQTHVQNREQFAGTSIMKTKVASVFGDIKGLVLLEQRLGGYWTWDVNDLEKV